MATETGHVSSRWYADQSGNLHLGGANLYDAAEVPFPQSCTITNAASTSNISLVTFQLKDGSGTALTAVTEIKVWLSDAATGIGLTATTASGAVAAGASGTDLGVMTTKKAISAITDATGKYILSITDASKTGFYPACSVAGTGKVSVGSQLTSGSYG